MPETRTFHQTDQNTIKIASAVITGIQLSSGLSLENILDLLRERKIPVKYVVPSRVSPQYKGEEIPHEAEPFYLRYHIIHLPENNFGGNYPKTRYHSDLFKELFPPNICKIDNAGPLPGLGPRTIYGFYEPTSVFNFKQLSGIYHIENGCFVERTDLQIGHGTESDLLDLDNINYGEK